MREFSNNFDLEYYNVDLTQVYTYNWDIFSARNGMNSSSRHDYIFDNQIYNLFRAYSPVTDTPAVRTLH